MSNQKRKKYDKAFKERVLKLMGEGRKATRLTEELGIPATYLYRWKREADSFAEEARFSGNGKARLTDEQRRIKELEKELADVRMEHEILKKAISIFSQSDRKGTGS